MNAAKDQRYGLLAKIHIARKALSLDEEVYREILARKFGRSSARDLSVEQLEALVEEFRAQGWEPKRSTKKAEEMSLGTTPQERLIRALWFDLKKAGKPRTPSEAGLRRFVKNVAGVDALRWLTTEQASNVIEGLKAWKARKSPEGRTKTARGVGARRNLTTE